ncbi:MAG: N-acetyltransferase [Muribaculaceae bacterium]|jgi:GNAT superfamily N-acetyltransferase|nr:N-acetyltransferase [Muribaculaceae bacterium]
MAIEIREIPAKRSELLKFVHFAIDLYKGNKYYVPSLVLDEVNTLTPSKNPAFDFCESKYFMAYKDGKPVGRIAGILNNVVNEKTGEKNVRFGFVDFIDDKEVSSALFEAVEKWGREKGMENIVGPLGFTDMDPEGMLVEGFDQLGTMETIYNYPYYPEHLESLGFEKDTDWKEFKIYIPKTIPDKMLRISKIIMERYGLRTIKYKSSKALVNDYGEAVFKLINSAYNNLYGYSPLTPRQIDQYIKMYLPLLPLNDIALIIDNDKKLVGVGISIPSLATALQKGRGRLFPFGWFHLLKALKFHNDVVDLLLIAVAPEFKSKGVNSLLFIDLIPSYNGYGYVYAESNPELELNQRVQQQWEYFDFEQHKRRRAFKKSLKPSAE